MAASSIATIPILIAFVIGQRRILNSMAASGLGRKVTPWPHSHHRPPQPLAPARTSRQPADYLDLIQAPFTLPRSRADHFRAGRGACGVALSRIREARWGECVCSSSTSRVLLAPPAASMPVTRVLPLRDRIRLTRRRSRSRLRRGLRAWSIGSGAPGTRVPQRPPGQTPDGLEHSMSCGGNPPGRCRALCHRCGSLAPWPT